MDVVGDMGCKVDLCLFVVSLWSQSCFFLLVTECSDSSSPFSYRCYLSTVSCSATQVRETNACRLVHDR